MYMHWKQFQNNTSAEHLLKVFRYDYGRPPIDIFHIIRGLSIHIKLINSNEDYVAYSEYDDTDAYIYLNTNVSKQKQRMAAAYQLGHILFKYKSLNKLEDIIITNFVYQLLMPAIWIKTYIYSGVDKNRLHYIFDVSPAIMKHRIFQVYGF